MCGYQLGFRPWSNDCPKNRGCPCCGMFFGHDDTDVKKRETTYLRWRLHWIATGKRWTSTAPEPDDYDPNQQLAHLGKLENDFE